MGVNSLPKTVTRQHRDCDLNLVPSASRVQHANHSANELRINSHNVQLAMFLVQLLTLPAQYVHLSH